MQYTHQEELDLQHIIYPYLDVSGQYRAQIPSDIPVYKDHIQRVLEALDKLKFNILEADKILHSPIDSLPMFLNDPSEMVKELVAYRLSIGK